MADLNEVWKPLHGIKIISKNQSKDYFQNISMSSDNKVFLGLSHYEVGNKLLSDWLEKGVDSGLGNLLFQVAAALSYAKKYNSRLQVPALTTYFNYENIKKEDSIFRKVDTDETDYKDFVPIEIKNPYDFNSPSDVFVHPFKNKILLKGHFENYNNFNNEREMILDYFSPNESDIKYLTDKFPEIKENETCSVHIRGGDRWVKTFLGGEEGFNKIKAAYDQCIQEMINRRNIKTLIILTNDKKLSEKILKDWENKLKIIYSNETPQNDIWTISLIKNNISTFSTLSWWGSYLNKHDDKLIMVHKKFLLDLKRFDNYILPEWTSFD